MKKNILLLALFASLFACKQVEVIPPSQPISGNWKVSTLDATDVSKFKGTLIIKAPSQSSNGTSGCNQFNANTKVDSLNLTISFSPIITTKIGCLNDLATFEQNYYQALQVVDAYEFENQSVVLKEKGKKRLVLVK